MIFEGVFVEHRSALITGASRGIGLGIASRLAAQGYGLTIAARDAERLERTAADLRQLGASVVVAQAGDISDEAHLEQLVASHAAQFGVMDALILNAGVGSAGELAGFHPKRFDKQIAINLRAPFVLMQQALPLLRKALEQNPIRGAKILAIASITGVYAEAELSVYGATKAALMSLVRSVNVEETGRGVTATAFAPAYVDTDMAAFKHDVLAPEDMIPVSDIVELADACLRLSARTVVPEIVISRASGTGYSA